MNEYLVSTHSLHNNFAFNAGDNFYSPFFLRIFGSIQARIHQVVISNGNIIKSSVDRPFYREPYFAFIILSQTRKITSEKVFMVDRVNMKVGFFLH